MRMVENRYDFVLYFDCQDGNPNGDPDSNNEPRFDPDTFQGLVTDVCIKRKIRDYIFQSQQENASVRKGYEIFVLAGNTLESRQRMPYDNLKSEITPAGAKTKAAEIARARSWMCEHFFDVRTFGAVMSTTEFNCGQVRGPVQITFARSVDRVFSSEHTIYRQAFTGERDIKSGTGTFGKKHTVAYGLYRAQGFISPAFARQTGFHEDDLTLLWKALGNMFELDRSATRGLMSTRELFVFKHRSALGNAPAHRLFELVTARKRDGVETPRCYFDYVITAPIPSQLPDGVDLLRPLEP
jgi:CRISPR-associated protein Csd2